MYDPKFNFSGIRKLPFLLNIKTAILVVIENGSFFDNMILDIPVAVIVDILHFRVPLKKYIPSSGQQQSVIATCHSVKNIYLKNRIR